MRWSSIYLIFCREVRDQIRDRRTLFMIFVLPILLYPILGIGIASLSVAFEQKPRTVIVVGAEYLPATPPLLNAARDEFMPNLFDPPSEVEAKRLHVRLERGDSRWADPEVCKAALRSGAVDAVVLIPPDVRRQIDKVVRAKIPVPYNSADEKSQLTYLRVREVLAGWQDQIVRGRLEHDRKPESYTEPLQVERMDVATREESGGSVWARIFPFLLVMMSLTGAFYPAVDLCAGEKERGTMETLLISPATRPEIVMGKFLTVMLASIATALLNLISMGLTGWQLAHQLAAGGGAGGTGADAHRAAVLAAPTLASAAWMILLLIPLSAFFSALCLALAVLARSMKEGQYYMTPLYMVALPLIFMTLAPGVELNLFTSLVPITGVSLLLRALMQAKYDVAWTFSLPVLVPTIFYGLLSLRWAIDQFNSESVLFREAERFDVRGWLHHILVDKEPLPKGGEALFCFALMLCSAWFLSPVMGTSLWGMAGGQVAFILLPPVAMSFLLTSDPRRTLRLRWPSLRYVVLGVCLALALNPLTSELRPIVERLFPIPDMIRTMLAKLLEKIPDFGTAVFLLAAVPAVCEEVAFRGYILSGLERGRRLRSAIVISAVLFGFLHVLLSLFQQLFNATLLGVVLGMLAVRSRSLLPGILFHFANNALALVAGQMAESPRWHGLATAIYRKPADGLFHWHWIALGAVLSAGMIWMLIRGEGRPLEPPRNLPDDPDSDGL